MPTKSKREFLRAIDEALSPCRWKPTLLEVRTHDDEVLIRVGGCWDTRDMRYVKRPVRARVVKLQKSQLDLGRCIARYVKARLRGEEDRIALLMAIGNRGGGKTFGLALLIVLLALGVPGSWQICVSITAKQKRDVMGAIVKITGARVHPITRAILPGGWIVEDNKDLRDPNTVFRTGSTLLWASSKNPDSLRIAELDIEHVLVNEGQGQPVEVFNNAAGAIRNKGGIVSIATNPPQRARGNYIAKLYRAIDAQPEDQPKKGEAFIVAASGNEAIHQATLEKIRWMMLAADRRAAAADADGVIKVAGELGYPDFVALPLHRKGHLLDELALQRIKASWRDVTREETEKVAGSAFDFIAGVDFQGNPGSCATIGKLYRDELGRLRRIVLDLVATDGSNTDLTRELNAKGYFQGSIDRQKRPAPGRRLLLVADATGKHQGPRHDFDNGEIYSHDELRTDGWTLVGPDVYKNGAPANPLIPESRRHMQSVFRAHALLLGPECEKDLGRFPSLSEGFSNTLVNAAEKFVKKDHFTHFCDCERYACWAFLVEYRPSWSQQDQTLDGEKFDLLASINPSFRE